MLWPLPPFASYWTDFDTASSGPISDLVKWWKLVNIKGGPLPRRPRSRTGQGLGLGFSLSSECELSAVRLVSSLEFA